VWVCHEPVAALARGGLQQSEQLAGRSRMDRGRLKAVVVEQVSVAGDDRLRACRSRERDEEVVGRIAQHASHHRRIGQRDREEPQGVSGSRDDARVETGAKVGLRQTALELRGRAGR
jgi:hypothetical protein